MTACGGAAAPQNSAPDGSPPQISVAGAWARPSPMTAGNGAIYMQLKNSGGSTDALVSASTDVAEVVEIHESIIENDVMKMHPVEKVEIPAGGMAMLEPGGYHVMLINLKQQLEPDSKISVTLNFEQSDPLTIEAEIKDMGMMDSSDDMNMSDSK
jgi:hypothetical protein